MEIERLQELMEKLGMDAGDDAQICEIFFICRSLWRLPADKKTSLEDALLNSEISTRLAELPKHHFQVDTIVRSETQKNAFVAIGDALYETGLLDFYRFADAFLLPLIRSAHILRDMLLIGDNEARADLLLMRLVYYYQECFPNAVLPPKQTGCYVLEKLKGISQTNKKLYKALLYLLFTPIKIQPPNQFEATDAKKVALALGQYIKNGVSTAALLSDYYAVKFAKDDTAPALNTYKAPVGTGLWVKRQRLRELSEERGVTLDETLLEDCAIKLHDVSATVFMKEVFYPPERNDIGFELGVMFDKFIQILPEAGRCLIVHPSPHFLLKWFGDKTLKKKEAVFAVASSEVKALYNQQFHCDRFITFSELDSIDTVAAAAFFFRDYKKREALMNGFKKIAVNGRVLAFMPAALLDRSKSELIAAMKPSGLRFREIMMIGGTATNSAPRKKRLCYMTADATPGKSTTVRIRRGYCESSTQMFFASSVSILLPESDILSGKQTLQKRYTQAWSSKRQAAPRQRNSALQYAFSPEINLWYTVSEGRRGRVEAKASFRAYTSSNSPGKNLSPYTVKGLRVKAPSDLPAALERVAYYPEIANVAVPEILRFFDDRMVEQSLKTIWYCCRSALLRNPRYKDKTAKEIFSPEYPQMGQIKPAFAYQEDYACAMDILPVKATPLQRWQQLNFIFIEAGRQKYVHYNPVYELLQRASSQATIEQREVRNALAKRSLTHEEEACILQYLMKQNPTRNSKMLIGAIQFFTGMSVREICALTWADFVPLAASQDAYYFAVSKYLTDSSVPEAYGSDKRWKYRRVPVVPFLAELLCARRKTLQAAGNLADSTAPIVLAQEPSTKSLPPRYCSIQDANNVLKRMISAAKIKETLLQLPGPKGTYETDINKVRSALLVNNFRYRSNHTCQFTAGETAYTLGTIPPDTYSRNYVDYTNDFVQIGMIRKLHRWAAQHADLFQKVESAAPKIFTIEKIQTVKAEQGRLAAVGISATIADAAELHISCAHGFSADLQVYHSEEVAE